MYEALGFEKNPFFTDPLNANEEDYKKFIGRKKDVHTYLAQVTGREGCVHLVTGNRGVGKTSFVNIMQYVTSFDDPKKTFHDIKHTPSLLIANAQKIQINSDDTAQSLTLKITSSIIYSLVRAYEKAQEHVPARLDKQHKRINELIISSTTPSAGLQLMGTGGSLGGVSTSYEGISAAATSHLTRTIQDMLDLALPDLNKNGIYVIINNLDIVDTDRLVKILNELRDEVLSIKSLWIVLLGSRGTYLAIKQHEMGARIVDNLRGTETVLEALSESEAVQILDIRAKKLSQNKTKPAQLPISENIIREIYKHCDGEIRFLFKVCDQIVRSVLTRFPTLRRITDEMAFEALRPIAAEEMYFDLLSRKQKDLLIALLDKPLRPKDYKLVRFSSAQHFAMVASELCKRHLARKREEGIAVYYEPAGQVVLARYCGLI